MEKKRRKSPKAKEFSLILYSAGGKGRARRKLVGCGLRAQVGVGCSLAGRFLSSHRNMRRIHPTSQSAKSAAAEYRWVPAGYYGDWNLVNLTAPSECRAGPRSSESVTDVVTKFRNDIIPIANLPEAPKPPFSRSTILLPSLFTIILPPESFSYTQKAKHKPPETMNTAQSLPRFLLPRLSWQGPLSSNVPRTVPSALLQTYEQQPQTWQPLCSSRSFHSNRPTNHAQCTAPSNKPRSLNIVARNPTLRRSFHASAARRRDHHFDTLKFVQRLQEDGFTEEQSVAMMKVLNDVIEER